MAIPGPHEHDPDLRVAGRLLGPGDRVVEDIASEDLGEDREGHVGEAGDDQDRNHEANAHDDPHEHRARPVHPTVTSNVPALVPSRGVSPKDEAAGRACASPGRSAVRGSSPQFSPIAYCGRRTPRGSEPYSLKPLRQRERASVDYAFSAFQSVRPATTAFCFALRASQLRRRPRDGDRCNMRARCEGRPYIVSRINWSRRFSFSSVRNSS